MRKEKAYVITWMNLEDIMLSRINQPQKGKHFMIYLYKLSKVVKLREAEHSTVASGAGGKGKWGVAIDEYKVAIIDDEQLLEIYCTTLCLQLTTLKNLRT